MRRNRALLRTGIAGMVITAICCFTPVPAIVFGAAGLAAWLAWLDFVLLPLLVLFLGMTAIGIWRRAHAPEARDQT